MKNILIPLIVGAIRRSLDLSEAMEARAFGAKENRTNLYLLKIKVWDIVAIISSLSVIVVAIYVRLNIILPSIQHFLP